MSWKSCVSISVAVAVIIDDKNRLLITQRPLHVPHGGYWEFPGGKLEKNETSKSALIREVKEEIGLEVHHCLLLGEVNHQYSDKSVKLIIFLVDQFSGTPLCLEGQLALKWVYFHELTSEQFPEANLQVISLVEKHLNTNRALN